MQTGAWKNETMDESVLSSLKKVQKAAPFSDVTFSC